MPTTTAHSAAHPAARPTAPPRVRGLVVASLALVAAISTGCLDRGPTEAEPTPHLRVIQAVPNAPTVNLVVDSSLLLNGLTFRAISGFVPVNAGVRRVRLISDGGVTTLVDDSLTFGFPKAYTLVATGMLGDVQSVVAPDTAPFPLEGEFKVRVIQAAPAAGAVDVYITDANASLAASTPVIASLQFRGYLDYHTVEVGRNRIRLTTAGTTNVLLDVTQVFGERSMRTIIATDAPGGGLPLTGLVLVDY